MPPPGHGDCHTGRATPATPGGGSGGHSGLGKPPGRGGSAFPLIGAANGGRSPLRVLAGGTSCATARAAVLIKLPARGDEARWPHGTGTVPPPCHPLSKGSYPIRACAATQNPPVPSKRGIWLPRDGKCGVPEDGLHRGGLTPPSFPPKTQPQRLLHPPSTASDTSKGVWGGFILLSPFLLSPFQMPGKGVNGFLEGNV